MLALLIQLPAYLEITEGLEGLKQYDFYFDDVFKYAEVRHHSWFNQLAYNFFKNNNMYIRLIGDKNIEEKTWKDSKRQNNGDAEVGILATKGMGIAALNQQMIQYKNLFLNSSARVFFSHQFT